MKLLRITLGLAILLGIAAGVVNFVVVKDKIQQTLDERDKNAKDRDDEKSQKQKAQKDLASTKAALVRTNDLLVATQKERDDAVAKSDTDAKARADAEEALKKTKGDLEDTKNQLAAWDALGIPLENIKKTLASLAEVTAARDALTAENRIVQKKLFEAQEEIKRLTVEDYDVKMPVGLKGKVLAVDPRFDFAVLDIGSNQGVLKHGRFLVTDNGKLVARVEVTSVQNDSCIANVMPGWKLSDVMEGDKVLY